MNEAYEVFGGNYEDCAGLAHAIMSSCSETLIQNANDGVRTPFAAHEPQRNVFFRKYDDTDRTYG